MANSLVGYIALLWQLASFCKGRVGDRFCDHSIENILFNRVPFIGLNIILFISQFKFEEAL